MTAPVLKALTSGFVSKQIIDFLIRKFPQHAGKIQAAVAMGFTPTQILKFVTGGRKELANPEEMFQTEHEKTLNTDIQRTQNVNKTAFALAAAPLAAYALSRALPSLAGSMATGQPPGNPPTLGNIAAQTTAPQAIPPTNILPTAVIPQQPSPPSPVQPVAPQAQPAIAPVPAKQQKPFSSYDPKEIIKKYNLEEHVINLSNNLKDSSHVAAVLYSQFPNEIRKAQKEAKKPIEELIDDYLNSYPQNIQQPPELNQEAKNTLKETSGIKDKLKNSLPKSFAILPEGRIADVESIKGRVAELNIDGKKHAKDAEKLVKIENTDELLDAYDNLISKIPEEEKSGMIYWAGYDDNAKRLAFLPHGPGSALYTYEDIPQEFADKLKAAMFNPKTVGQNYYGAWAPGEKSRGAGLSALIRELQKIYGGKGKEYSGKFNSVYDYFISPKVKSKERTQKKKNEPKKPRSSKKPRAS